MNVIVMKNKSEFSDTVKHHLCLVGNRLSQALSTHKCFHWMMRMSGLGISTIVTGVAERSVRNVTLLSDVDHSKYNVLWSSSMSV